MRRTNPQLRETFSSRHKDHAYAHHWTRGRQHFRKEIPSPGRDWKRRNGHGLQSPGQRDKRKNCLKTFTPTHFFRRDYDRAISQWIEDGPKDLPQECLPHVSYRWRGRELLHHNGICGWWRFEKHHKKSGTAERRKGGIHCQTAVWGISRGAQSGNRAQGFETAEHHDRPGWECEDYGFRDSPLSGIKGNNRYRNDDWNPGVHVAWASGRQTCWPACGYLFIRSDSLWDVNRHGAFYGRYSVERRS